MEIRFVPKSEIAPQFGRWSDDHVILIREDLPNCARAFLAAHEVYHDGDTATFWLWREIKANVMPIIGGLVVAVMSMAPSRLAYYCRRFREGK